MVRTERTFIHIMDSCAVGSFLASLRGLGHQTWSGRRSLQIPVSGLRHGFLLLPTVDLGLAVCQIPRKGQRGFCK